ncbi:AI-2E family transporter [Collinsella sp. zg1085]|uniref:AI-2E family transporter n=1 Tax=Collinsella sp. zg1085 TaxID=2844380 RepID=UPI001C0E082D|nr:AI-2E family transporter [Collinsella sp. zg1085]QWT17088.1 AI-2E family transporter [Collinsella sp. zg1085]
MAQLHQQDMWNRSRQALVHIWALIGLAIILMGLLHVLNLLSSAVMFLGVGCVVAFVASPMVNYLQRHHVPRGIAAFLALLVVVIAAVILFSILIPVLIDQLMELLRELPSQISHMSTWFSQFEREVDIVKNLGEYIDIASLISTLQDSFNSIARDLLLTIRNGIVPLVNNVASTMFTFFLGLVLAYWLACDYPGMNQEICRVLGDERAGEYRLLMAVIGQSVGGYLRSMIFTAVVRGVLSFIGFSLVAHPYAAAMAVITGILSFIPVIGPLFSAVIVTLTGLFAGPIVAFWSLVAAMVAQNITDNVIGPKITESTMSIHPVVSLLALMIGSALGGAMGMVIAIPAAAVAKNIFVFYYESRTGRQVVSYNGVLFKGTPYQDVHGAPVPAYDALGNDRFAIDSELIDAKDIPLATAAPKPEGSDLDTNPWDRIMKRMHSSDELKDDEDSSV